MHAARIAGLLAPFLREANDEQSTANDQLIQSISMYIDLLLRWNARINLTAIRDPEEIVTRHFGESLFAARHLFSSLDLSDGKRIADLGSGAGFPGVPIKLWAPEIALTLIESSRKKSTFLRELSRALTLTNVDIQNVRAETLPAASFDVVILRAVERFAEILPVAANLLVPSGRLALLIGRGQIEIARTTIPQLSWLSPIPVPESDSRYLLIGAIEP